MSRKYLIRESGKFYKANLHCHTTISDGRFTPKKIKSIYMEKGYSIVAFTDHCRYIWHDELDGENFLALAGFEANIDEITSGKCYHLNAFAKEPNKCGYVHRKLHDNIPIEYNINHVNYYIKNLNESGFFVSYNHPLWSLQEPTDFLGLEGLFSFEIYNHCCEMINKSGYSSVYYDLMIRSGKRMFCIAADDNHNYRPLGAYDSGSFGGYTMIKSDKLEYKSIVDSLLSGQFYASQAPEIYSLYIEQNKLCCDCSPIQSAFMLTKYRSAPGIHSAQADMTHFEFKLEPHYEFVRLELFDSIKRIAFTNPYYLSEI